MDEQSPPTAARADPRDLDGPFRHVIEVEVRFADTDAQGHVNNASYLTYCEMARIRYWSDVTGGSFVGGTGRPESLILAEARITYRSPVFYGDAVTVQTRATRIGRSSFTLEHRLTARRPDGMTRLAAVSDSVLVAYDYDLAAAIPLNDMQTNAIERFEERSLRG
jgi:acyl-CoA thioester hydrolase